MGVGIGTGVAVGRGVAVGGGGAVAAGVSVGVGVVRGTTDTQPAAASSITDSNRKASNAGGILRQPARIGGNGAGQRHNFI